MKIPSGRIIRDDSAGARYLSVLNKTKAPIIAIDTSDAYSALILEKFAKKISACWISSLGNSAKLGFSDVYNLSPRDYADLIVNIRRLCPNKSVIVDADNGGQSYKNTAFAFTMYAHWGVSVAFVENKRGVKFNSVDPKASALHDLDEPAVFAEKINAAIECQNETLVGVRLENAIINDDNADLAIEETLAAASYYLQHSRPDYFLFHWKKEDPTVPIRLGKEFTKLVSELPPEDRPLLAAVPTTYSKNITAQKLYEAGYSTVIYGNPLLRSQYAATKNAIESIEQFDSLVSLDTAMPPTSDILAILGR